jgi:hypothetical protein
VSLFVSFTFIGKIRYSSQLQIRRESLLRTEINKFVNDLVGGWNSWHTHPKMSKALSMLRKEKHNLMVMENNDEIYGVIKSQRANADLLYAVKLRSNGTFLCGTQNLRRCGGLRGSGPCKHLFLLALVLLTNGSSMEKLLSWYQKALNIRYKMSQADKEDMTIIFEEYAGVLTGEIEWREIETLPEDYLALS